MIEHRPFLALWRILFYSMMYALTLQQPYLWEVQHYVGTRGRFMVKQYT